MRFEWVEAKRQSNIRKHGIDFADVEIVFAGETTTSLDDRHSYNETRFLKFGLLCRRVVAIAHTETNEVMRIISVRKATKNEEIAYYKEIKN